MNHERRFADSRRAADRRDHRGASRPAHLPRQVRQRLQLGTPAGEAPYRGRQLARRHQRVHNQAGAARVWPTDGDGVPAAQNVIVQALQIPAGLHAKLRHQQPPGPPVGCERLGLSAAACQGEHEQARQPLPEGVLRHQQRQLRVDQRGLASSQQSLGAVLGRTQVQLGKPCPLDLRERARDPGQWHAAPHRQRSAERLGRAGWVSVDPKLARPAQVFIEHLRIQLPGPQPQYISWPG